MVRLRRIWLTRGVARGGETIGIGVITMGAHGVLGRGRGIGAGDHLRRLVTMMVEAVRGRRRMRVLGLDRPAGGKDTNKACLDGYR